MSEIQMCQFVGGSCHNCINPANCNNPNSYTPEATASFKAGKIIAPRAPTCPVVEEKYLNVFRNIRMIYGGFCLDQAGNVIAEIRENVILYPHEWFRSCKPAECVVVIKNPFNNSDLMYQNGVRNGLAIIYGVPFALAVSDSGVCDVRRPMMPNRAENIFYGYYELLEKFHHSFPSESVG